MYGFACGFFLLIGRNAIFCYSRCYRRKGGRIPLLSDRKPTIRFTAAGGAAGRRFISMKIINAKVFTGHSFTDGGIEFDQKILDVGAHVTGSPADEAAGYAAEGVTSWCPTTMTLKEPQLTKAMEAIRAYQRPDKGAKAVGIHLEGPFVSYEKRGAQNPDNIHVPDAAMFHRLDEASGGMVRLITMAPETPGAIDCIRDISKTCTVSVGHTVADYDTAMAAFEAGASHITQTDSGRIPCPSGHDPPDPPYLRR